MKLTELGIEGAWLVESSVYSDDRGFFVEWFKSSEVKASTGIDLKPVQANISRSHRGVVRGIHYSMATGGQAKLVTVMSGSIQDYAIDIRTKSLTFGKYESVTLVAGDGKALLLSSDLAHAFIALENDTVVSYLVSSEFNPQAEHAISPLCSEIGINWPLDRNQLILSQKDLGAPTLSEMKSQVLLP